MNKILVVDDSRMILQLAKDIIEKGINESRVTVEVNPLNAKEILMNREFHVVILDIVMPEVSGIELLQWIKNQKKLSKLKVIMFTSLNDNEALLQCFENGAYDFITKPLEVNEFTARVRHAIVEYNQEEMIKRNVNELKQKNDSLKLMFDKLKNSQAELIQSERLASVGFLAAGMAHEINNPLGYLKSNVEILKQNYTTLNNLLNIYKESCNSKDSDTYNWVKSIEDKVEYCFIQEDMMDIFEDLNDGISQITRIISSLRDFSQIDSGNNMEYVSLKSVFSNIKELTNIKFKDKAELIININEDGELYCNKGDIHLSFMSIIINSYEAIIKKEGGGKGNINISVDSKDDQYFIVISDDGKGIDNELQKNIFDPFFTTKDVGEGAGLGLTTAYNCIVNGLGGTIQIDSEVNIGTEVKITLPKKKQ